MDRYKLIIKGWSVNINYREILTNNGIQIYDKRRSDGGSIFIYTAVEKVKNLIRSFSWILFIIPSSRPLDIIRENNIIKMARRIDSHLIY